MVAALLPSMPGYEVESWDKNYPEIASALTSKNFVMDIFSVIIEVIAGIGVLNLLLMAVFERTREIGLLGAMGLEAAPDRHLVHPGRHDDRCGWCDRRYRARRRLQRQFRNGLASTIVRSPAPPISWL